MKKIAWKRSGTKPLLIERNSNKITLFRSERETIVRSVSENIEVLSAYLTEESNLLIKYQKPSALQDKTLCIYTKDKNFNLRKSSFTL